MHRERIVVDDEQPPSAKIRIAAVGADLCLTPAKPRREERTCCLDPASLVTPTSPPISSASRLLITRPRPVPPYLPVVDASACEKDWKRVRI